MLTILLVDDEPTITTALDHYFRQEGYRTLIANTGQAALDRLVDTPDLIILDLMLPDIDGYRVSQAVRDLPHYIPILMLTAKDGAQNRVIGLDLGADAYFTKPYDPRELLAQVRALLRLSGKTLSKKLTCGGLVLWPDDGVVECNGEPVALTSTEFDLLSLFMSHQGQVFGRQTILRQVWGYNSAEVTTRTIDTHIQRLRGKIEVNPKEPTLLMTVRGFGYRMICPS